MKYYFTVSETFIKTVAVEADTNEQAFVLLQQAHANKEFELDHTKPYQIGFNPTNGNKKDTRFGEPITLNCEDVVDEDVNCVDAADDEDNRPCTAKEKVVVFRCKYCIDDLKEYNPYVNKQGEGIPLENIICIEVSDEECENTTFELKPILLDQANGWYRDIPTEEQIILLNKAIQIATGNDYEVVIRVWEDQYARDEGLSYDIALSKHFEAYAEDGENPDKPAETLIYGLDGYHNKRGCAEVIAKKAEEEICFYHEEAEDEYFLDEIFDFIQSGGDNE